jgi:hypothetical protein
MDPGPKVGLGLASGASTVPISDSQDDSSGDLIVAVVILILMAADAVSGLLLPAETARKSQEIH